MRSCDAACHNHILQNDVRFERKEGKKDFFDWLFDGGVRGDEVHSFMLAHRHMQTKTCTLPQEPGACLLDSALPFCAVVINQMQDGDLHAYQAKPRVITNQQGQLMRPDNPEMQQLQTAADNLAQAKQLPKTIADRIEDVQRIFEADKAWNAMSDQAKTELEAYELHKWHTDELRENMREYTEVTYVEKGLFDTKANQMLVRSIESRLTGALRRTVCARASL